MKQLNCRLVNSAFTKMVEKLHHDGYSYDYCIATNNLFQCLRNNAVLKYEQVAVRLIGQFYDKLLNRNWHLYTVDTETGENGILLLPADNICDCSDKKDMSPIIAGFWEAW